MPVRLIAGFRKIKSLTKDLKVVVAALETSPELVVSGQRVRRRLPLPCVNEVEVLMRTVIVENLPHQATLGAVALEFGLRCCHSEPAAALSGLLYSTLCSNAYIDGVEHYIGCLDMSCWKHG